MKPTEQYTAEKKIYSCHIFCLFTISVYTIHLHFSNYLSHSLPLSCSLSLSLSLIASWNPQIAIDFNLFDTEYSTRCRVTYIQDYMRFHPRLAVTAKRVKSFSHTHKKTRISHPIFTFGPRHKLIFDERD